MVAGAGYAECYTAPESWWDFEPFVDYSTNSSPRSQPRSLPPKLSRMRSASQQPRDATTASVANPVVRGLSRAAPRGAALALFGCRWSNFLDSSWMKVGGAPMTNMFADPRQRAATDVAERRALPLGPAEITCPRSSSVCCRSVRQCGGSGQP